MKKMLTIFIIIVTLKDFSDNIIDEKVNTKEERLQLWKQRNYMNEKKTSDILSDLSSNFKLKRKSARSFSGNITIEGFNKIKNNSEILRIYHSLPGSVHETENMINKSNTYLGKNYKKIILGLLIIIVMIIFTLYLIIKYIKNFKITNKI